MNYKFSTLLLLLRISSVINPAFRLEMSSSEFLDYSSKSKSPVARRRFTHWLGSKYPIPFCVFEKFSH